ncbi:MAG TPA: LamG domain-containing protein [bacterium]|nr:LamG domain-containing protein [bacterium]
MNTNIFLGSLALTSAIGLSGCDLIIGIEPWSAGGAGGQSVSTASTAETSSSGMTFLPPSLTAPVEAQILAPSHAYVSWQDGPIPPNVSVTSYQLCYTTGPLSGIVGDADCPNAALTTSRRNVLDPLSAKRSYALKVRTLFDDNSVSAWSVIRAFSTDDTLAGWWRMDGNSNDLSPFAHAGVLQNGAAYEAGLVDQALLLDGIDDQMTVANTNDHNFGTGDFTLAAWIFPLRDGVAEALITKRSSSNGYELFRTTGGQLAFFGSGCGIAAMGGSLPIDEWHRAAVVRAGGMIFLTIDGIAVGTGNCGDDFNNTSSLALGCNGQDIGCVEPFQGRIDEASIRTAASNDADLANDLCADLVQAGVDPLPSMCL